MAAGTPLLLGPPKRGPPPHAVAYVVLMGTAFALIFTAWIATQNFAVKLLNSGSSALGSWLIGVVYMAFIVSNQIAASVVGLLGAKWTTVLGSIGYFVCTAGVASMNTVVTLAGGMCVGLGGGMLWSGQGRMITDLSTDENRGFNSGLFYSLMLGGSGLGGFVVTFLFAPMEPGAAGSSSGGSASAAVGAGDDADSTFRHAVGVYFTVLCIPVGLGCLMLTLMPNLPKPTEQLGLTARIGRTWSVLATREMLLLAPYCFQIGVAISFTTFFYRVIRDTRTLAIIGLWNCFGSFIALPLGRFSDSVGRRPIALLAMALDLSAYYLATLAAEHQPQYDPQSLTHSMLTCGPACYAGLLDGAAMGLYQLLQAAAISTLFADRDSEAAFAVRDTWLSVSSVLGACVLTQLIPGPAGEHPTDAALKAAATSFQFVASLCGAWLVLGTTFYAIAEPQPCALSCGRALVGAVRGGKGGGDRPDGSHFSSSSSSSSIRVQ
jgi:MFS family permease